MGQQEVFQYLSRKRKWLCVMEISVAINVNTESVRRSLNQMFKYREVMKREIRQAAQRHRVYYWKVSR